MKPLAWVETGVDEPREPIFLLKVGGHKRDVGRVNPSPLRRLAFDRLRPRRIELEGSNRCLLRESERARVESRAKDHEMDNAGEIAIDCVVEERHTGGSLVLRGDFAFIWICERLRHVAGQWVGKHMGQTNRRKPRVGTLSSARISRLGRLVLPRAQLVLEEARGERPLSGSAAASC
jgi:hypothetical protein